MSDQSTRKRSRSNNTARPPKPFATFPLSPHPSGAWQKKIGGKIFYYGRWGRVVGGKLTRLPGDGWKEALALYEAVETDDRLGRPRRAELRDGVVVKLRPDTPDSPTVRDLCNKFLTAKKARLDAGLRMSPRMFAEYKMTTDRIVATFGKDRQLTDLVPDDFARLWAELAGRYGPVRLTNEVTKVKTVFKYAVGNKLMLEVPYGTEFVKPDRTTLRKHRAASGKRLFAAAEVRALVAAAGVQMRAMILLGINAAFGNNDVGTLPLAALDLDAGWCEFPRGKTGIERKAKLWPETVAAVRRAIAERPTPTDPAAGGLVFVTKYGNPWASDGAATAVSHEFGKLLKGFDLARPGVGFYSLRHTFRTVADAAHDLNAIRTVMGHTDDSIDANYTHGIADERLAAVAEHVRAWVYPPNLQQGNVTEGDTK